MSDRAAPGSKERPARCRTSTIILQILWTSLATSTYYVLFAVAFALVLKVTRLFNFAQAGVMTIAFYTAFVVVQWLEWPAWAAFIVMMVVTLAASCALERIGFEALRRRGVSLMFVFMFTFMVSEFVAYVAMLIFGTWPQTIFPTIFWPVTLVGEIAVSALGLPAMRATVAALAAFFAFMRFTRSGQFMIAVADNPGLAELYGIDKRQMFLVTMLIAGAFVATRHVPLRHARAGTAADRPLADAVRRRRDDHRRHRQCRRRGDRGGDPRHRPERQHSRHPVRMAGLPALHLPVLRDRVLSQWPEAAAPPQPFRHGDARYCRRAGDAPAETRPEPSWNISTASSSSSASTSSWRRAST